MSAVLSVVGRTRFLLFERWSVYTFRYGLIALAIVLCAGTGLMSSRNPLLMMAFPALLGGLVAFLFVYYNIQTSLLILLVITCIGRIGVGTGTGTAIMISFLWMMLITVVWLLRRMVIEKSFSLRPMPALVPGLFFITAVAIAALWSGYFVDADVAVLMEDAIPPRIMTVLTYAMSFMAYLLVANYIRSPRAFKFIVWWYIGYGAVIGLMRAAINSVPFIFNDRGQVSAFVGIMALSQALFNRAISFQLRMALLGVVAVWVYVTFIVGRSWLSGWLPLFAGCAVVIFFRARWPSIIAALLIVVVLLVNFDVVAESFSGESEESGGTRLSAWENMFNLVQDHLLFGVGPAGYKHYFDIRLVGQFWQATHNNYLDMLGQVGVVGFVLYIWLWLSIAYMSFKSIGTAPPGTLLQGLAISCFAGVCVSLLSGALGDWITPFAYTQGLAGIDYTIWHWFFAGLSVAVYYASREAKAQNQVVVQAVPKNMPMLPTPRTEILQ